MGFYLKDHSESDEDDTPEITKEMAEKLLMKLFQLDSKSPKLPLDTYEKLHEDIATACAHIGEYIHDLMFQQDFSLINITITKNDKNQLKFYLNKTEL